MNDLPRVSIVTPSYNQGNFLERTILSVLNQDYPNIEYIVMDGGSTDESKSVLEKYANRLTYWESKKDRGQSDAINKGWRMATGKYCSYLNSDDELAPGAVRKVVDAFLKNPEATIVHGDYTFVDENNNVIMMGKGMATDFKTLLIDGQMPYIAQPSSFYLTAAVKEAGYIDERLHLSMDYDLLLKLAKNSVVKYIPSLISYFRLHSSAKSSTLMKKHWHETLRVKMKYNKIYMYKSLLYYLRFRLFHLMPEALQKAVRMKRGSINDIVLLKESK
jgi:glycosyltransferase involved in cell wall biosynthesis